MDIRFCFPYCSNAFSTLPRPSYVNRILEDQKRQWLCIFTLSTLLPFWPPRVGSVALKAWCRLYHYGNSFRQRRIKPKHFVKTHLSMPFHTLYLSPPFFLNLVGTSRVWLQHPLLPSYHKCEFQVTQKWLPDILEYDVVLSLEVRRPLSHDTAIAIYSMSEYPTSYPECMGTDRMHSDPQEPNTDLADRYYVQFANHDYCSRGSSGSISSHFK